MTVREHAWEAVVAVLSWIVAIAALAFVAIYVATDALKRRRASRAAAEAVADPPATSLQMELAS